MEAEENAVERLNQCLQKLLGQYYDKTGETFQLCICERVEKKEASEKSKWRCLSEDSQIKNAVERFLLSETGKDVLNIKKLSSLHKYILYVSDEKNVKDSNFNHRGDKVIRLIFLSKENKKSHYLLLKIISDELLSKINDMLLLETVKNNIDKIGEIDMNKLKKNPFCLYFFGNLLDKDWISKEYVKRVLLEEQLPDWKTFLHLSAMFYEKRTIKTCLYFVEQESGNMTYDLEFANNNIRINIGQDSDFRMLRKLMELSGADHGLTIQKPGYEVLGVINKPDEEKDFVCVEFTEHMVWQLKKGKEVLFKYQKGEYKLPELESGDDAEREISNIDTILENISASFPNRKVSKAKIKKLVDKVKELADHGTTLIFMDCHTLKQEVKRLVSCQRAIAVKTFDLSRQLGKVENIFSIDGAVLLDFSCNCKAIGAIVDGKACPDEKGKARGARYNSISGYVRGLRESDEIYRNAVCMAVIFSEDKMINVIEQHNETT